jgi:hypothetical protein
MIELMFKDLYISSDLTRSLSYEMGVGSMSACVQFLQEGLQLLLVRSKYWNVYTTFTLEITLIYKIPASSSSVDKYDKQH